MFDITIVGGGILGTSLSFWLSQNYKGKIAVLEAEKEVAFHTSRRNTAVIHRPFYLNPEKRKIFALCAQTSYGLWKELAKEHQLPWSPVGTLEVAVKPSDLAVLEKYSHWAAQNGMKSDEFELLSAEQVRQIEPRVHCLGALYCKTDTAVNYEAFSKQLAQDSSGFGTEFLMNHNLNKIEVLTSHLKLHFENAPSIETRFLINCAGGRSMDILHQMGLGLEYTDLHFRGEYWQVSDAKKNWIKTNIYSVPRHAELPFLDPHWIVRANGTCEIGPNAVLVAAYNTYNGFFNSLSELFGKVLEQPRVNKLKLFSNKEFLHLAADEWKSSLSKNSMVRRAQSFIPEIKPDDFVRRGIAGIRSSVIDNKGNFLKEAIEVQGPMSYHITNYNSPGATGAPAYAARLVQNLEKIGALSYLQKRDAAQKHLWNFSQVCEKIA